MYSTCGTWGCGVDSEGPGQFHLTALRLQPMWPLYCTGCACCLWLFSADSPCSRYLWLPGVSIASSVLSQQTYMSPFERLPTGILTLPHMAWLLRPSFEVWVEASVTLQPMHSAYLQNQHHVVNAKVWPTWVISEPSWILVAGGLWVPGDSAWWNESWETTSWVALCSQGAPVGSLLNEFTLLYPWAYDGWGLVNFWHDFKGHISYWPCEKYSASI